MFRILNKKKREPEKKELLFDDGSSKKLNESYMILPLVITKGVVFGPQVATALEIEPGKSAEAFLDADKNTGLVCICDQPDITVENPDITQIRAVGCLAEIKGLVRIGKRTIRIGIEGRQRVRIHEICGTEPFYTVRLETIHAATHSAERDNALYKILVEKFTNLMQMIGRYDENFASGLQTELPDDGMDMMLSVMPLSADEYYSAMEITDTTRRLNATIELVARTISVAKLELDIETKLAAVFSEEQKMRYLREKQYIISKELSEDDEDDDLEQVRLGIEKLPIADEYKNRLLKELTRLEMTPPDSREASTILSYFDCLLDLPWDKSHGESFDIKKAVKKLEEDHYGIEKVKSRIIEYLAVLKLVKKIKGPILCLVGPPGVGKTSVARSVAEATGRKFTRISLGGMDDEAEIRGHRKTYVGAMPGRIIAGLRQAQSRNLVFLLDEIDKLSKSYSGDPASALLEVLDPEQNTNFTDAYLEVPFDLSNVMFITTANSLSTVPRPLMDRMEVIELPGYMPDEKTEIAKRHLINKQLKLNGLTKRSLHITDDVLSEIINCYTHESGVRELERSIASLCRKAAKAKVVEGRKKFEVTVENLGDFLGPKVHTYDIAAQGGAIGVVNGLAWTGAGGDTLQIEAAVCDGTGKLELTGNLGDVMKESARAAVGHLRANADTYGISREIWEKSDIHIHVPEGAVPKDGPSAGIAMATALISALSSEEAPQKTAMTGEITLTGRVLPIGGLREKLLAARRAEIERVILPEQNERDLKEVPANIKDGLEIVFVSRMQDVYRLMFGAKKKPRRKGAASKHIKPAAAAAQELK